MERAQIKQELQQYIDCGDERLLKLMYAMAKAYNGDDDIEHSFTELEIAEFDRRRQQRLEGKSETYSWEEAKKIIPGRQ